MTTIIKTITTTVGLPGLMATALLGATFEPTSFTEPTTQCCCNDNIASFHLAGNRCCCTDGQWDGIHEPTCNCTPDRFRIHQPVQVSVTRGFRGPCAHTRDVKCDNCSPRGDHDRLRRKPDWPLWEHDRHRREPQEPAPLWDRCPPGPWDKWDRPDILRGGSNVQLAWVPVPDPDWDRELEQPRGYPEPYWRYIPDVYAPPPPCGCEGWPDPTCPHHRQWPDKPPRPLHHAAG